MSCQSSGLTEAACTRTRIAVVGEFWWFAILDGEHIGQPVSAADDSLHEILPVGVPRAAARAGLQCKLTL